MLATALPSVLPAPVAAPAPTSTSTSTSTTTANGNANGNGNGPESFARMLDAADARRQAPAPTDKAPDAKPAAKTAAERAGGAAPASSADTGGPDPAPADGQATDTGAAATATATAVDATGDPGVLTDPALANDAAALLAGLAALPRPAPAEAASSASTALGARMGLRRAGEAAIATGAEAEAPPRLAAEAQDTPGTALRRTGDAAKAGGGSDTAQSRDPFPALMRQARADPGASDHAADAGTPRLQAVAARTTETQPAGVDSFTPGAALLGAAPSPGASPAGAASTVSHARLSASPGSAEFAGQLGAQLTTFVREGVQHARLELHPLELGPVTVQIAIDGTQARVNLAAEHAATRQALEQAMPALAGSLRDAGLTLSGGGVFEQPRQPQPDSGTASSGGRDGGQGRGEGGERAGSATDLGTTALSGAPLRRRGVIDLVA